jgi:omega-6 fatty acid desaturase (delta-12 desaturase)
VLIGNLNIGHSSRSQMTSQEERISGVVPNILLNPNWGVPNGPAGARDRLSTMTTNIAIALLVGLMVMWLGWSHFLAIHGPITLIAASIGVWLFYVQHQFEDTLWVDKSDWTQEAAALGGSSYYRLPQPLAWFTANIGLHHIHHLLSRIPFYRLPDVFRRWPGLEQVMSLTLSERLNCVHLALWDEDSRKLVAFRAIKTHLHLSQWPAASRR